MIAWLFPPESFRRLLPETRGRPTLYVIAIMTFVTMVIAAAALALANAAALVRASAESRISIQLPDGRTVSAAAASLKQVPGIEQVTVVPEADVRATLEKWLGPGSEAAGLPVPALIDVRTSEGVQPGALAGHLRRVLPAARIATFEAEVAPLGRSLQALQWLALGLIVLMAAATSAAVVLAARGALDTNRGTIEIMHGIGATDRQVVHLFQRRIALDALTGGLGGALAATLVLVLVLGPVAGIAGLLQSGPPLRWLDLALLAVVPVALAILATVVARVAVQRALRATL